MENGENIKLTEPDVLQYTNYRVYLKDYYEFKKKTFPAFSLRFFAQKAGLSSHTHLKLTIEGKRNITKSTVFKLVHGIGLDQQRAFFFENLVFFNQASTEEERQAYYEQLVKCCAHSKINKIDKTHFYIFKEWYRSVILEMFSLRNFRPIPSEISAKLNGRITPAQAQESLDLLTQMGFLVKTANGFRRSVPMLMTGEEPQNMFLKEYHEQMLCLMGELLNDIPAKDRDFSGLTFGIRRSEFANLKRHIQLMYKELLNFSAKAGEADDIVQVNIQLCPLVRGV